MTRFALILTSAVVALSAGAWAAPAVAQVPGACAPDVLGAPVTACVGSDLRCVDADAGNGALVASVSPLGACHGIPWAPTNYAACRAGALRIAGDLQIITGVANKPETPCVAERWEQWPRVALSTGGITIRANGLSASTDLAGDPEYVWLADGTFYQSPATVKASVSHVQITGPGFSVVARGVAAVMGDTPEGIRSSARMTRLTVNGDPLEFGPRPEQISQTIAPGVVLHVNEDGLTPGGHMARRALRIETPNIPDIVIAEAMLAGHTATTPPVGLPDVIQRFLDEQTP